MAQTTTRTNENVDNGATNAGLASNQIMLEIATAVTPMLTRPDHVWGPCVPNTICRVTIPTVYCTYRQNEESTHAQESQRQSTKLSVQKAVATFPTWLQVHNRTTRLA